MEKCEAEGKKKKGEEKREMTINKKEWEEERNKVKTALGRRKKNIV